MKKRIFDNLLFDRNDLLNNTCFDLIGLYKNEIESIGYKNLNINNTRNYTAYGVKQHKIWKLIYVRTNKVVEVYYDKRGISFEDFEFLKKYHINKAKALGLNKDTVSKYSNKYIIYLNADYELVIDRERIIVRDVKNKIV